MIVEALPAPSKPRPADRNILSVTDDNGIYRPSERLVVARDQAAHIRADPDTFVKMHVRRLDALRRAGIVERIEADHWRVPDNLPERGLAHDLARDGADARVNTLSPIGLERQVSHKGAAWLDRTMIGQRDTVAQHGFGADVRAAWEQRKPVLADMGLAEDMGEGRFRASKDLIQRLETMELRARARLWRRETCRLAGRRPDRSQPVKAAAVRGGACRASLDRLSPARQRLAKQIRLGVSVGAP